MEDLKKKYRVMVDSLYRKTFAGSLDWDITFLGHLEVNVGNYSIRLSEYKDEEGEPFEKIEILGSNEKLIDGFTDSFLNKETPPEADFPNYYMKMKDLHQQARRKAMGLDQAIDEILGDLDDDIPF